MKAIRRFLLCILCLAALSTAVFGLSSCGEEVVEECPHSWNSWETVIPPTCQAEGLERRACKLDSTHIEERTVAKLDHSFENYVSNNDATCAKNGTKTAYCTTIGCTESNTVDDIGSQLPHDFTEKVISDDYLLRAPSCTKPASYYYSCYCGACGTETFEDGEPQHSFATTLSFDEENHWYECSLCKAKNEIAPHEWDEGELVNEANCTEDGKKVYTCACGATREDITPAHHTLVYVAETASTCTHKGNIAHWQCTASECGKRFADEKGETEITNYKTDVVDHVYSLWTYDESANTHAKKCIWCDSTLDPQSHEFKEGYDANAHFVKCECGYVLESASHKLFAQKNSDAHWYECSECDYVSAKSAHTNVVRCSATQHWLACSECDWALEKSYHEYGEGVVTKEHTCTEYGTKTYTCSCGYAITEKIDPAHNYSELIPEVDSTCTEEGTKAHYVCLVCEKKFINTLGMTQDLTIPVKEHNWVMKFDSAEGHWFECLVCGTKEIDDMTGDVIIIPHTVEFSQGNDLEHYFECECGYTEENGAHFWGDGAVTVPADCFNDGVRTYTCFCGKTKTEVISHHSLVYVEAKAATICNDGNIAHLRCEVCENTYYAPGATAENHEHLTITEVMIPAPHNFEEGEVQYDESGHWSVCTECGAKSPVVAHTTERTGPDADGYFWIECKECDHKKKEEN